MPMEPGNTLMKSIKSEITVFAGPNGSGKSTIKSVSPHVKQLYINADDIKLANHCSDIEAAKQAEQMRNECVDMMRSFSFETVLSTDRNINLLKEAKEKGYFIRGIFVLTNNPELNILRVLTRIENGGHDVPEEKIISRFSKSVANIPQFVELCDVCHIYDNTGREPKRIFKKKKKEITFWTTQYWSLPKISRLVNIPLEE